MAFPKMPIPVIVISIILAVLGGFWGAHAAGLIDLNSIFSFLPFVEKKIDEGIETDADVEISPQEKENKELKEQLGQLETQLREAETTVASYTTEIQELNKKIALLEDENATIKVVDESSSQLAEYYQEMKPKAIVEIFEKLDDQIVINILVKLESDHVAKILSEMDPVRAAKLTRTLTD